MTEQSAPRHPAQPFTPQTLDTESAFRAAGALYSRVFGYHEREYSLNPHLLSALVKNGGSAVGVFSDAGELVGFVYGFAGRDRAGQEYHYSQAAVVDPAFQDRGIGGLLKAHQRKVALSWGQRRMRWTFDPMLTRNAHFNLSRLHAEGIAYADDYYDRPGTDRLVVEWRLDRTADPYAALRRATPPELTAQDWGRAIADTVAGRDAVWLALPAQAAAPRAAVAPSVGAATRDALRAALAEDRVLVACARTGSDTAAYLAVSRSVPEEG